MYKYSTFEEEAARKQIRGRVLRVLEFDKIAAQLATFAKSEFGKELAENILPTTDSAVVTESLEDTNEAFIYINKYGQLPLGTFPDIRGSLAYAKAGGVLTMRALLDIAVFLRSVEDIKKIVSGEHADMYETNLFTSIMALEPISRLEKEISSSIDNEDEMNDRASDTLYNIRREKKELQQSIRVLLDRVIRNNEEYLQEAIITIRGDRYCVPVRVECKSRIPGIVHDTSSTGQTVFIEPLSVVEANNRIRELAGMEKAEIERILEEMTGHVLKNRGDLNSDIELVKCIDFASAKANLAIKMNAVKPALNTDGRIRLVKARHPLIDPEVVVAVDIENGIDYTSLIITGPNTGGKTVSLKTCGLLTLMTMAGLMIPASTGSEIAVFDRVLADIGDEQSIEQSLSTFSAHMSNIVFILKNVRGKSLVLLDELGSGTDPAEGAALAVAVLDELKNKECTIMATTHYKELKAYAISTEGVMNAAFEFDTDNLAPTYKLIIGMPGASNAFVISKKLGLPNRIIDKAKEQLSEEEMSYEMLLSKAEADGKEAQRLKDENEKLQLELKNKIDELEAERVALKKSKTKILNDSRAEQRELLKEKEEELNELIRQTRKKSFKNDKREVAEEMDKIRRRLRAGISDLTSDDEDDKLENIVLPGEPPKEVLVGQTYSIPHLNAMGVVKTAPKKNGSLQVTSGGFTFTVNVSQLRMPTNSELNKGKDNDNNSGKRKLEKSNYKQDSSTKLRMSKVATTMPELMLIGKTMTEAESLLDRYIDDCQLSGIKTIRIVHGKGTGALRSAVNSVLTIDSRVKDFRLGMPGEGDDGVTIATLY